MQISQQSIHFHLTAVARQVLQVALPETTLRLACVGPPGADGPPGPAGADGVVLGAFMVVNRFSELDTGQARIDARTNLELNHIDCGEYL